jgi:hypothetical protein
LLLTGDVDVNGDGMPDYSGDLLRGEVLEFGFGDLSGQIDVFDFRFRVTGGAFATAGLYTNQDIGVELTVDNGRNLNHSFTEDLSGRVKGILGPMPKLPCTGTIGDFVWMDLTRNGLQDSGEPGINGVELILYDAFGYELRRTSTTDGPAGAGYYQFGSLCRGDYGVDVDGNQAPLADLSPTLEEQGTDRSIDSNFRPVVVNLPDDDSSDQTIGFGPLCGPEREFRTRCVRPHSGPNWPREARQKILATSRGAPRGCQGAEPLGWFRLEDRRGVPGGRRERMSGSRSPSSSVLLQRGQADRLALDDLGAARRHAEDQRQGLERIRGGGRFSGPSTTSILVSL